MFARAEERQEAEYLAARMGIPFRGLWLEAGSDVLHARVAARTKDASDATPDVLDLQLGYSLGEISWVRIDANRGPGQTFDAARSALPEWAHGLGGKYE